MYTIIIHLLAYIFPSHYLHARFTMNICNRMQASRHQSIFFWALMNIHNHIEEIRFAMPAMERLQEKKLIHNFGTIKRRSESILCVMISNWLYNETANAKILLFHFSPSKLALHHEQDAFYSVYRNIHGPQDALWKDDPSLGWLEIDWSFFGIDSLTTLPQNSLYALLLLNQFWMEHIEHTLIDKLNFSQCWFGHSNFYFCIPAMISTLS